MDERLKQIAENFDNMKIGLDDPFSFSCNKCGKCCINRDDILLSPLDLYRMSKKLNITPNEFVTQYGKAYIGDSSRMVIVRLKPQGSIKRCPLLKDRKCSVHDAKPTVCAMYPIGRAFRMDSKNSSSNTISTENIEYIFNGAHCGNAEIHTVREWFDSFGIPIKDEFFVEWQKTITELHNIIVMAEKNFKEESTMNTIWSVIYAAMYMKYDTNKEFMPQFLANREEMLKILSMIPEFYLRRKKHVR